MVSGIFGAGSQLVPAGRRLGDQLVIDRYNPPSGPASGGPREAGRNPRPAYRGLLLLAQEDDYKPVLIADIAERHNLPKKFLEQILLDLKHHGLVQSRRGRSGGYSLLNPASILAVTSAV
jgi:hypothetical protein